jgi:hypothetical protein
MASHPIQDRLDFDEQIVRIERMIVEIQNTRQAIQFEPRKMYFEATLSATALLGAGAAFARIFLPS